MSSLHDGRALLLLSPRQQREWYRRGSVTEVAPSGRIYRFRGKDSAQVELLTGRFWRRRRRVLMCVLPQQQQWEEKEVVVTVVGGTRHVFTEITATNWRIGPLEIMLGNLMVVRCGDEARLLAHAVLIHGRLTDEEAEIRERYRQEMWS